MSKHKSVLKEVFSEVYHNVPKNVKKTKKKGTAKRKMLIAIALQKSRARGVHIPKW